MHDVRVLLGQVSQAYGYGYRYTVSVHVGCVWNLANFALWQKFYEQNKSKNILYLFFLVTLEISLNSIFVQLFVFRLTCLNACKRKFPASMAQIEILLIHCIFFLFFAYKWLTQLYTIYIVNDTLSSKIKQNVVNLGQKYKISKAVSVYNVCVRAPVPVSDDYCNLCTTVLLSWTAKSDGVLWRIRPHNSISDSMGAFV